MRATVRATRVGTIADLNTRDDLSLVTTDYEVEAIKEHFGNRPTVQDFGGFLVKIGEGDYDEVYGFEGSVPGVHKSIYKVTLTLSPSKSKSARKSKPRAKRRTTGSLTSVRGVRR